MTKIANSGEWATETPDDLPYDRPSAMEVDGVLSLRASAIGGCPVSLRLILEGHVEPEKPWMQKYFVAGHELEAWLKTSEGLAYLETALGYSDDTLRLVEDSTIMRFKVGDAELTGHTDGILGFTHKSNEVVLEVKSTGRTNFDKWVLDGIDHFKAYPEYLWQILAYLVNEWKRTGGWAIYVVIDRESKDIYAMEFHLEDVLDLLGIVSNISEARTLAVEAITERIEQIRTSKECQPSAFCDMDDIRVELQALDEDWLNDLMERRLKLSAEAKDIKEKLDKANKDIMAAFVDGEMTSAVIGDTGQELYIQNRKVLAVRKVKDGYTE